MIRELLRADKIEMGLRGPLAGAIARLVRRTSYPERTREIEAALCPGDRSDDVLVGPGVAVARARLPGLEEPELLLGVGPEGLDLDGRGAGVVAVLLTPAEQPALHLQLLQRLSSLLPALRDDLLHAPDPASVVRILAEGEQRGGAASFINLTQEQVARELDTDLERGLTAAEAARRLRLYGRNVLRRPPRTTWPLKLLRNLFSFFAALLWAAALLCFVPEVGMPQLGVAIVSVIVVNGLFAFLQEARADRAVEMLEGLLAPTSRALRDGRLHTIEAGSLVPGDIIVLEEGDLVPADARLIEAFQVEVDNSPLTGESTSAKRYKSDRPLLLTGRFLWIELPNIVFAGTALVRGQARAVVFGTGMSSEVGKIAEATERIRIERSPLQKELRTTVRLIGALAAGLGVTFMLLGWKLAGLEFGTALVFFIGMFVANVPEGLLPTVTLSLSMAVARLARRGVLVKSLPAVDTLGCTTVICCDKTGTLTESVMRVTEVHVDGRVITVTGTGYRPQGELRLEGRTLKAEEVARWPALRRLLECALVCNNARLEKVGSLYRPVGDHTEGALVALAEKAGLRGTHHRLHVHAFESVRKRMSVVVAEAGRRVAYVKGAPLEVLERCALILRGAEAQGLTDLDRRRIREDHDALARRGLRLLALAYREGPALEGENLEDLEQVERGLTFLGLTAMSDPVRPGVPEAVTACHGAGIRLFMITGDYGLTAASVATQVGIGGALPRVITGAELALLSDHELRAALSAGETVFARVSPEHKLRIVTLLQALGEVVAVTGDGVNDAPALKKADIGIAMGLRGNAVAKEAAVMILTDDDFASMVAAIEEGRAVFDNIRRFAAYILNSNPQEMYPYILWMLLPGFPLAMTVMGVLAVDVGTDLVPAMGLGIEPPEKGIMQRPPRPRREKLVSLRFILRAYFVEGSLLAASCFATYFYAAWVLGFWRPGLPLSALPASPPGLRLADASTPYLQTLTAYFFPTVTAQIANVLAKRSWSTSLFAPDFLSASRREEVFASLARFGQVPRVGFLARGVSRAFRECPVLLNLLSNPLVNLGLLLELLLCAAFFYTPLGRIYGFAPVPWHVYAFAFHGTLLLIVFSELAKRRRRFRRV